MSKDALRDKSKTDTVSGSAERHVFVGEDKLPGALSLSVLMIVRRVGVVVIGTALLLVCIITLLIVTYRPQQTPEQRNALVTADKQAEGFDKEGKAYNFVRLNTALDFATDKKCAEASVIYKQVSREPQGVPQTDLDGYKARIDSLCK